MRHFLVFGLAVWLVPTVAGSPLLAISPIETTVAPGDNATVEIVLSDASNFAGFYMELEIAGQPGAAGAVSFVDAYGDDDPRYCFYEINDLFQSVVISDTLLALGDQTSPPSIEVSTVAGVNDLVAIVEVSTSPDSWGTFDLTFDMPSLELFDQYGAVIPGYDQISITQATIVVPEPSMSAALAFATLLATRCPIARRR